MHKPIVPFFFRHFRWPIHLWIVALSLMLIPDYTKHKDYNLEVLDKMIVSGKSANAVMVLKTEDGIIFDQYVSFATYSQFNKGDKIVMELSRMQIKQTFWENLFFFFGMVVFLSFAVVFTGEKIFTVKDAWKS